MGTLLRASKHGDLHSTWSCAETESAVKRWFTQNLQAQCSELWHVCPSNTRPKPWGYLPLNKQILRLKLREKESFYDISLYYPMQPFQLNFFLKF